MKLVFLFVFNKTIISHKINNAARDKYGAISLGFWERTRSRDITP